MIKSDQQIAQELVKMAKLLISKKKGEVPEAFKKQWKNKDKDGDGKENEPKPDFVKEIEKKKDKKAAQELVDVTKLLIGADTFKCPDCGTKVLEQTEYCVKCKKKVKKASTREAASSGSFHRDGNKVYVDTAFLNHTRGILPGSEMKHLQIKPHHAWRRGQSAPVFYLDTPNGQVDFDRMRGKDFEGQSGRSHLLSDDQGGALMKALLRGMESKGKAVEV